MIQVFLVFLLASFIGGGLNGIFVRFVSLEFGPFTGAFLRCFGAVLILSPFWFRKKEFIKKREIIKFLPFSINMALFSIAIQHTSVIMANVLYAFSPILVAFFGFLLLGEKLLKYHIIGLIVSIIGVTILIQGSIETSNILTFGEPLGNILILVGAFIWAFWIIGARSLSKRYSWITILFFAFLTSTVVLFILMPFEWVTRPFIFTDITARGLGSLFGVIIFSSILLYYLYQWLIKYTSAFIASLIQYGSIVFGSISGSIVFQERFTFNLIIGGILVFLGVFLATSYQQAGKYFKSVLYSSFKIK